MMIHVGLSSASPDHLDRYVATARSLDESLRRRLGTLADAYARIVPRLQWGELDASGALAAFAAYVGLNDADDEWVATVSAAFRAADAGGGGVSTVDSAAIDAALLAAGIDDGPRADLTVDDPILAGGPVTSGFANDPVCTATGHFVEHEVDLPVPAPVQLAGWSRTYSSRWLEPGPFGRGWASWASTRLDFARATVLLPDGRRGPVDVLLADRRGWRFDDDGRLISVGPATFDWDGDCLRRVTHAAGRSVALVWDGSRVSAVHASDGRIVRYEYDSDGDLVGVDGPCGRRRYEVRDGLILAVIDADGVELVRNSYDPDGRVLAQRSSFGRCTRFGYPGRGITVVSDDDGGPSVTHVHDRAGRLVGAVDDHGARFTKVYDEAGNPVATSDRTGAVVRQAWDGRGRLLRREEPDGAVTAFEWDDQDPIVDRTGPAGATVRLS
jgi:YD repeat-containing protein